MTTYVHSMTGFAKNSEEIEMNGKKMLFTVQLKSLNGKACEVSIKAPQSFFAYEIEIHRIIKAKIKRGTVVCFINYEKKNSDEIYISHRAIEYAFKELTTIQDKLGINTPPTLQDVLSLPGILKDPTKDENQEQIASHLVSTVGKTIDKLLYEFILEGKKILETIEEILTIIINDFSELKNISINVIERKKAQINEKMQNFLQNMNLTTHEQLSLEIFKSLEKIDIAEELQRFQVHLEKLHQILYAPENEKGRHLEFILQELFREINTLGVKCGDTQISSLVVNIKVSLEKIREQIQNIM